MKPTEHLSITERPGTCIVVMSDSRGPIIVVSDGPGARACRYTSEQAAKLSLAVLESAGVAESSDAGVAANYLRLHISEQERATAEARELAELEAEALELMNVRLDAAGNPKHLTKETVDPIALEAWLAVARRAREMRNEKKEPTND